MRDLIAAVPYRLHTVLTDRAIKGAIGPSPMARGIQFTHRKGDVFAMEHIFNRVCREHGIEHRLTKPNHPWSKEDQATVRGTVGPTNGQVERMNRTIKDATVKRFHYDSHDQLRTHLADFLAAYNFARRLKTLGGFTPYEHICKVWTSEPDRFILDPIHQMPGLSSLCGR